MAEPRLQQILPYPILPYRTPAHNYVFLLPLLSSLLHGSGGGYGGMCVRLCVDYWHPRQLHYWPQP